MTKQSPPNTLMIVHPTPWDDGFFDRIRATYFDIWDEILEGKEESEETGYFEQSDHRVWFLRDPKIDQLTASLKGTYPPFEEAERILAEQHQVSWRLFAEEPDYATAQLMVRIAAAVTGAQSVATLIPSTTRAFPPAFTRQLCATDNIETIVSLFVHAWNDEEKMRTRGLTAFGFPEIEIPLQSGMNESYFDLLDLSASFILDGFPDLLRPLDVGRFQYKLSKVNDPTPDPESPIAGFYGVWRLER